MLDTPFLVPTAKCVRHDDDDCFLTAAVIIREMRENLRSLFELKINWDDVCNACNRPAEGSILAAGFGRAAEVDQDPCLLPTQRIMQQRGV